MDCLYLYFIVLILGLPFLIKVVDLFQIVSMIKVKLIIYVYDFYFFNLFAMCATPAWIKHITCFHTWRIVAAKKV